MIEKFVEYIRSKGLSVRTEEAYLAALKQFVKFCQGKGIEEVTKHDMQAFVRYMREKGMSNRSIVHQLSAIHQFYKFLIWKDMAQFSPVEFTQVKVGERRKPRCLSIEQVGKLLEAIENPYHRAMVEFLYATGCRVSEMLDVKSSDINWDEKTAKVLGKGAKWRPVMLNEECVEWMRKCESKGERFFGGVSRQMVFKIVQQAGKAIGLKESVSPHVLRHSFATHVLRNGADLVMVKDLLGHASITSTAIYTHATIDELKSAHHRFHPRK